MKAHLTIESANPVVKVALEVEGRFVIGRSNAADLPLNDPAISRQAQAFGRWKPCGDRAEVGGMNSRWQFFDLLDCAAWKSYLPQQVWAHGEDCIG